MSRASNRRRTVPVRGGAEAAAPPPSSLARLFPSPTLLNALALLLLTPDRQSYHLEIADKTASTGLQVQRALQRIEQAGLARRQSRGKRVYYQANRTHPAFDDLCRALLKTVGLAEVLQEALRPVARRVTVAFVFGSIAAGGDRPDSDIDLLIVGDISLREATRLLEPATERLDREVNPVIFPAKEIREKIGRKDHFVTQVIEGPKIWILGSHDELARLAP